MSAFHVAGALLSGALFVYLFFALLYPEKWS